MRREMQLRRRVGAFQPGSRTIVSWVIGLSPRAVAGVLHRRRPHLAVAEELDGEMTRPREDQHANEERQRVGALALELGARAPVALEELDLAVPMRPILLELGPELDHVSAPVDGADELVGHLSGAPIRVDVVEQAEPVGQALELLDGERVDQEGLELGGRIQTTSLFRWSPVLV